jgi:hypothetical protein
MLYNICTGIYKFGNNTYPRRIRRRSNLGHIFRKKKCVLWVGKYGNISDTFRLFFIKTSSGFNPRRFLYTIAKPQKMRDLV